MLRRDLPDLEPLIARCRRRDSEAWAELIRRFQSLVYSIPRRMGLNEDDSADVFQTTFQALLNHLDRIESAAAIPKWLSTTASRESIRLSRAARNFLPADPNRESRLEETLEDLERSAEAAAVAAVESDLLRHGLEKLGDPCRTLLNLLFADEPTPYEDIAQRLKMPIGAIGPTRGRCLTKLRKLLTQMNFFAADVSPGDAASS